MPTFEGTIKIDEHGNAKMLEQAYFKQFCHDHKGKKCEVVIKPLTRKSDPLRRYYFGVVVEMIRQTLRRLGHQFTKDDTHNFIKQFAPSMAIEVVLPTGEIKHNYRSIADKAFTNTDFLTYIEEVRQWAAEELDLVVPDPNEY